jgi:peptidoglycan/xylan/chitin deacetylase (PgdA/CDA1 family)
MKNLLPAFVLVLSFFSCKNPSSVKEASPKAESGAAVKSVSTAVPALAAIADPAAILQRKQVPILCYHHIKDVPVLPKNSAGYTVTVDQFRTQMKALADSGYHSITPDQLYQYLTTGAPLPSNPVMITYDDTDEEQFTVAKAEMDKYGFKGVFFIMTVSIGRPRYMTKEQIKQLSDEGHTIACHTWDHHRTDKYIVGDRYVQEGSVRKKVNDWNDQLDKPRKTLEDITGKKIEYFAYPFGVWNEAGIPELRKRGYKLAFQLATKRDQQEPLYTVRRVIVGPSWGNPGILKVLRSAFQ